MVQNPQGPRGERECICVGWGWVEGVGGRTSMEWTCAVKALIDGRKNLSVQVGKQHDS